MAPGFRFLLLTLAAPLLPAATGAFSVQVISSGEAQKVALESTQVLADTTTTGFDFCLKDPTNGSILRFNSTTGAYVVCGSDGTFEQGVGTVTKNGSVTTLSHAYGNRTFNGLVSAYATVNSTTGEGQAYLNASSETQPTFKPVTIDDPNVNASEDCSACDSQAAIGEGVINLTGATTAAFALNTSQMQFNVLQKYSLNPDFAGNLTRLYGGIGRNGAGPLTFNLVVYPDSGGVPGSAATYVSPPFTYPSFPAYPIIGIIHQNLNLKVGATFWAGFRYNPTTNPAYFPYDSTATSPDTDVYGCGASGPCQRITISSAPLRNFFLSADYKYPGLYQSGSLVRYAIPGMTGVLSDKCGDGSYEQISLGSSGVYQLYAEPGMPSSSEFPPGSYEGAFARVRRISDLVGTGLDGKAETKYATMRFSAFSFIGGNEFNFCTRPKTATDYVCHTIPGYQAGTGGYTRITGVSTGLEASYANSVADRIDRVFLQYNGSNWTAQPLNPVTSTPSIGSPEHGYNWHQARSFKVGVVYEYKLTSGPIEAQLLTGNTVAGKWTVDTDDPPLNFNPNLASQTAGDCAREGWCVFGRLDLHTQNNVADIFDFSASPPEIKSILLGSSPLGLGFGRAININARDGKALYGSYSLSPTPNQYRLQLDYIDLNSYTKFSLGFDYAAGIGNFPLSLAREGGFYGLGHARGIDTFYSLTESCSPVEVRGRGTGSGSSGAGEPRIPCETVPININHRF